MSIRKRFLTAAVVAALTALTAACAGGTNAANDNGGDSSGGTLKLASVASDKAGAEALIAAFKKNHPDVNFTTSYADTDQYQGTLRTQLASGTAPDVFFAWPGNGNPGAIEVLAPSGYLLDLSDRPWVKDIPSGIKPVTVVDGKTYVVPETFAGIGALYNKKALADIGGKEPTTYSEMLTLCDTAKSKGKVLFALGNQTNWVTQLADYALASTLVYGKTPDFAQQMKDGKATFASSAWKPTLDKYLEMNKRGCFSANPLGTSVENAISQVAGGKSVGMIYVTSGLNQLQAEAPSGTEFGMFAVPATDNASDTQLPGAAGGSYAVNAKTKSKKLALEFIDFLGTPEAINAYATATGNLPGIPNDQFKVDPALQPLLDAQKAGKTVPFMDQLWPNPKVQNVHFAAIQDMFAGKASPDQVLTRMDEAYKAG
ncbi:ABC transporter substrate-binding protein [Cryptosporangium phraense]|uniref:Extracellular solute-binding protein n=1 Tax=Cryptosporangium phraense TaxID=2593070 RepID=A0A545AFM1_9ACTN|nr:extracellular solute-binding protein [Cryptosporangium phraense]TQS40060.1 extracellular solute-binding protein [Cryptosporangium phraense]